MRVPKKKVEKHTANIDPIDVVGLTGVDIFQCTQEVSCNFYNKYSVVAVAILKRK